MHAATHHNCGYKSAEKKYEDTKFNYMKKTMHHYLLIFLPGRNATLTFKNQFISFTTLTE